MRSISESSTKRDSKSKKHMFNVKNPHKYTDKRILYRELNHRSSNNKISFCFSFFSLSAITSTLKLETKYKRAKNKTKGKNTYAR